MPRSPLNHDLIITQDFTDGAGNYPKSALNPLGQHKALDLHSPLNDTYYACVQGVVHLFGFWPYKTGYGAGVAIDYGQAGGGHYRIMYAHGHNRAKEYNNHHVAEGTILGYSGATGHIEPPGPAGAHLHFEVRHFDDHGKFLGWIDPKALLTEWHVPFRHK